MEGEDNADNSVEDIDMSEEGMESNFAPQECNVEDWQHLQTDPTSADEFMNELRKAVNYTNPLSPQMCAQLPFRSVLDIPEIKLEESGFKRYDYEPSSHRLEPEMLPEETMGLEGGEEYDEAWTGM